MKKKTICTILATVLIVQTALSGINANASEYRKTTEYIVQTDSEKAFDKLIQKNEDRIVETGSVEELEEQQIVVLELTDREAEKLNRQKDVLLVEENITFEASVSSYNKPMTVSVFGRQVKKNIASNGKKENRSKKNTKVKKKRMAEQLDSDDLRSQQWNLEAIHLPQKLSGDGQVKVAVLDSGVSFDLDIDVMEHITINEEQKVDNVLFDDATGHGTALAGIIAAKNDKDRVRGINPNAQIYSIQVLDDNNQTTLSQVVAGIYLAIDAGCDIINMSFGTTVDSEILHGAVRKAYDAGILMVAAAGNNGGRKVEFPAAYEEVMAVGSTDTTGNKISETSDGQEIEIFAPGSQILTTGLFGGSIVVDGTSIAAAQVSGAASLLWSMDKGKSAGFIRSLLANTAQNVDNAGISGAGLMDIENAVSCFDDLAQVYEENICEYLQIQMENKDAEEYIGVKLVNGLWNGDTHANIVNAQLKEYKVSSNNIRLMQEAAKKADIDYIEASLLHGSDNYVKTLKFLFLCAKYVRSGKSIDKSISLADSETNVKDLKEGLALIEATRKMLNSSIVPGISESSSEARFYKVMGFALHVTGDVFAHRTIVPGYTVNGTNPSKVKYSKSTTSADARFGTSDFASQTGHSLHDDSDLKIWAKSSYAKRDSICRRWNCFQRAVNLGVIEFKDIKNFSTTSTKDSQGTYEDNTNFCKERYADAKLACEVLFEEAYYKQKFDGVLIYMPVQKNGVS